MIANQTITLVKVENPFDRYSRKFEVVPYSECSLAEIKKVNYPSDVEVITSVNGQVVPLAFLHSSYLKPGDFVTFIPELAGGGDIFRTLAFIALAVTAFLAAPILATAMTGFTAGLGWGAAAQIGVYWATYAVATMAIMGIGGMMVNSLLPPPSLELGREDFDTSQAYNWSPKTTQQQGVVIPKYYGLFKSQGNVISTYTESMNGGKDNYLNVLLGISLGRVRRLYNYYINDQPIANFTAVDVHSRLGLLNQALIPNFNDTKTQYSMGRLVANQDGASLYTTIGDSFDGLEVDISFPRGLFYSNDQGGLDAHAVNYRVEIKKQGDSNWTLLTSTPATVTVQDGRWSLGFWINYGMNDQFYGVAEWIEGLAGSGNYTDHYDGEVYGNYRYSIGWYWSTWRWLSTGSHTSNLLYTYTAVSNNVAEAITFTCKSHSTLVHGRYDIRVTKVSPDYNSSRYGDAMYISAVRELLTDDFIYPRVALVGLKALASNQLSGSLNFSCMVEGSLVRVYRSDEVTGTDGKNYRCKLNHASSADNRPITGGSWATYWEQKGHSAVLLGVVWTVSTNYSATPSWRVEWSDNAAWVCYDVLTQPIIKDDLTIETYEGIYPSRLILATWQTWADFCDVLVNDGNGGLERRITFNGCFDTQKTLWEAALDCATMGRAILVWSGFDLSVVIDQQAESVYMFTVGNIIQDSFEETFMSLEERAGEIEVQFVNKENNYERDTASYFNTTLNKPSNKVAVQAIGVAKPSEAWRMSQLLLGHNLYDKRIIKYDVDIDAIRCTVGDVVKFQHDVPQWGEFGGRLESATENTIRLDQDVILASGKIYAIALKLFNDTLVTKTIVNPAGTWRDLTVSGVFSTIPHQYDLYALGESGLEVKEVRIMSLSRTGDQIITVGTVEYNKAVYAVDTGIPALPVPNYSALVPISVVTGLTLSETSYIDESGAVARDIIGSFILPNNPLWAKAEIYYRPSGSTSWEKIGETTDNRIKISKVQPLTTYEVSIISVSWAGVKTKFNDFTPVSITTSSYNSSSNIMNRMVVTGLQLFGGGLSMAFSGKDCKFEWNVASYLDDSDEEGDGIQIPLIYALDYVVEIYDGSGVRRRTELVVSANNYTYTFSKNTDDGSGTPVSTIEIRVRARDRFGNTSERYASLTVTNNAPYNIVGLIAKPVVGGVEFSWNRNTEEDFRCYAYRTKVGIGNWGAWIDIEDNHVTRSLTAAEVTAYTNLATIYVEVKAKDWYNQVSATAASTNEKAHTISDSLFQLTALKSGGTGTTSSLYDGVLTSGGVTVA